MLPANSSASRLATRLSFFVAGFGIACWAPLVPFAKHRLGIDDAILGLLLLCIGAGSVIAMIATGPLSARYGSKPVIVASGFSLAALLPLLAVTATPLTLGLALLLFGAALGSLDVAINVHAVEVERASDRPLMSGFHALFSIGGFTGAGMTTLFLSLGIDILAGTLISAILMAGALATAQPRLLTQASPEEGPLFVFPLGFVLLLSVLAMVTFLAEGAMLDWSALLVTQMDLLDVTQGGVGYILFALAMTVGRLVGDKSVARIGDFRMLFGGGCIAVAGFVTILCGPNVPVALAGFVLIGLGASNIVPILFRRAGNQTSMPPSLAISALTMLGYAGILVGPAGIGMLAKAVGLASAFWILGALLLLVPLSARRVAQG